MPKRGRPPGANRRPSDGETHVQRVIEMKDTGPNRQGQDSSGESGVKNAGLGGDHAPPRDGITAAFALINAIRDGVPLEQWALDELLDLQPSNEHAKALLSQMAAAGIVRPEDAELAMIDRGLVTL